MGEYFDQIPEAVRDHIRQLSRTARSGNEEEDLEAISKGWVEKKNSFEEQLSEFEMDEVDYLDKEDERGALIMTYSGSLLNLGPLMKGARKVEYASIGLRKDVPQTATKENSELSEDIEVDKEVVFSVGPVKSSSPVFKIAVPKEHMDPEEQEEMLARATQALTMEFIEVNKTIAR